MVGWFVCPTVSSHGEGPSEKCWEKVLKSSADHAGALPVHRHFALGTSREENLPQIFSANYKVLEKAGFGSTEKLLF